VWARGECSASSRFGVVAGFARERVEAGELEATVYAAAVPLAHPLNAGGDLDGVEIGEVRMPVRSDGGAVLSRG
jgi:hypothetical protein